ncbi:hypothetical protein [Desulfosporosinus fructosivorans]
MIGRVRLTMDNVVTVGGLLRLSKNIVPPIFFWRCLFAPDVMIMSRNMIVCYDGLIIFDPYD